MTCTYRVKRLRGLDKSVKTRLHINASSALGNNYRETYGEPRDDRRAFMRFSANFKVNVYISNRCVSEERVRQCTGNNCIQMVRRETWIDAKTWLSEMFDLVSPRTTRSDWFVKPCNGVCNFVWNVRNDKRPRKRINALVHRSVC
jgi:hypothetical protein